MNKFKEKIEKVRIIPKQSEAVFEEIQAQIFPIKDYSAYLNLQKNLFGDVVVYKIVVKDLVVPTPKFE